MGERGYPDVYAVFANDKWFGDRSEAPRCENERHLYAICGDEDKAKKFVKKLNTRNSMYEDAYYETWAVQ